MTGIEAFWQELVMAAQDNEAVFIAVVLFVAGAESIIGLSLLVPSSIIFLAAGALIGSSGLELSTIWVAATLGAILGDVMAYAMGAFAGPSLRRSWPVQRFPGLWNRAELFFGRWGTLSVLLAKFAGPSRSVVSTLAGSTRMPLHTFGAASAVSSGIWAAAMLAPGALLMEVVFNTPLTPAP